MGRRPPRAPMSRLLLAGKGGGRRPPPPDGFLGSVPGKGAGAAAGTNVTATIGGNVCGQTTVQADSSYVLDVVSSGQTAGGGTEGASGGFTVGGSPAGSAAWSS